MINKNTKRGFTLVEVLVSMLVIGIVLALTMPAITRQKNSDTSEKWDYGIMPYNITYSPSSANPNEQDVSIGTDAKGSRLTVEGSPWRSKTLEGRTADVILQSSVSNWTVLGILGDGIPLDAEEYEVNSFENMSKVMFDQRSNIGIGRNVLSSLESEDSDTAKNNIAIGTNALSSIRQNTTTNSQANIAIGSNTLARLGTDEVGGGNHDDFQNVAIGSEALALVEAGKGNYAVGSGAGGGLELGSDNIFVGNNAGRTLSAGSGNIFIGANAGGAVIRENNWTTGDPGLCAGIDAADECVISQGISTGNYNIFIGANASPRGTDNVNGMILISNGPTTSPEQNILGEQSQSTLYKTPLLLMYPDTARTAAAGAAFNSTTTAYYIMWTRNLNANNIQAKAKITYSDARMKDIKGNYERGLEEILKIKPVTYYMKDEKIGSKRHVGVIAQDLKKVIPEAVIENNGYYGVQYQYIDMAMVNAVKELDKQEDELEARISKLEEKLIK